MRDTKPSQTGQDGEQCPGTDGGPDATAICNCKRLGPPVPTIFQPNSSQMTVLPT